MTYNDLKTEVAALGFETELENSDALLSATRRAVTSLFIERPVYSTLELYQHPISMQRKSSLIHHKGGDSTVIEASAKAYSFKTFGKGVYIIKDSLGERSISFSNEKRVHRGFLLGDSEIEFSGEYSYTVSDLCLFDELISENENDIPILGGMREYDIKKLTDGFLSFSHLPTDESGREILGASLLGSIMKIPEEYEGKIRLVYKTEPTPPSGDADEPVITPPGCAHLLPLAVSAYVWLDDDAEKSQYYMNLYRDGLSAVKVYSRISLTEAYNDTTGWA